MPGYMIDPIPQVNVKFFKNQPDAVIPERKTKDSVGYDLCTVEDFTLWAGVKKVVNTGLIIQPPPGFHTEIFLRSSLALKKDIILVNSVGLIDRDYAGDGDELKLVLYRLPLDIPPVSFKKGDRLAQLVFRPSVVVNMEEVDVPPGTTRGGFGSTGR